MISSNAGLEVTREQLRRAERILELNKRDFGHNPVQYQLFSGAVIDLIDSLRAEIDAYTGATPARDAIAHSQDQPAAPETARS